MILVCGIPSESPVQGVIAAAGCTGVHCEVVNQRQAAFHGLDLQMSDHGLRGSIALACGTVPLASIRGVYVRLMDYESLPECRALGRQTGSSDRHRRAVAFHAGLHDWLDIAKCRVLNRPKHMASNMSKPFQSQFIRQCSFRIPRTIITNDPDAVRSFKRCCGRVIYKSTSSIRSIVRELTRASMRELDRVEHLPTQFQEYIPGTNLRIHVVGDRFFATEIRCEAVDYRYAGRENSDVQMRPVTLPGRFREACLALCKCLGLPLAGIDFKRTDQGEYYCLEVNPSPAYNFYQDHTGQPIAEAIVDYLEGQKDNTTDDEHR
jgi:glutathione synthase/RimK-type ligase-like ATP-grasp enzyme